MSIKAFFQKVKINKTMLSVIFTDSLVQPRLKTEKKRQEVKLHSCPLDNSSKRILNWAVYWIIKDKQFEVLTTHMKFRDRHLLNLSFNFQLGQTQ